MMSDDNVYVENSINTSSDGHSLSDIKTSQDQYLLAINTIQMIINMPLGIALIALTLKTAELRRGQHNIIVCNILMSESSLILACFVGAVLIKHELQNGVACKLLGALTFIFGLSSWLSYVALAFERYSHLFTDSVFHRLFHSTHRRWIRYIIGGCWALPLIQLLPFVATANDSLGFEEMQFCGVIVGSVPWKIACNFLLIVATPLLCHTISMSVNLRMYRLLRIHKLKHKASIAPRLQQTGDQASLKVSFRDFDSASKLLFVCCMLPLLFQMPLAIAKLFAPLGSNAWVSRVLCSLYLIPPMLSPFLVLHFLKPYRSAFAYALLVCLDIDKLDESEATAQPNGGEPPRPITVF